jgi:16S rRNA (guanine966-N2)-methyltransferase
MRISGGQARGIQLVVPKGDAVRPATDGLRQAVFSSLGSRVVGARFLDLFAGSGAYGLEALSRGASSGLWVERHGRTADCLRRNVSAVCRSIGRSEADLTVLQADATTVPWVDPQPPDLVFIDPPYEVIGDVETAIFQRLTDLLSGHPDPVVVFEMPGATQLASSGWQEVKRLGKGAYQPTVAFFKPRR